MLLITVIIKGITRLHPFACSWLYNATAVRGALWWLRKSRIVNYAIINIRQAAARLSPSGGTTFQTTFSPVSFGKSFMKIRSAVPENGCLSFGGRKRNKKNICKTYTHPPPTGRRLRKKVIIVGLISARVRPERPASCIRGSQCWYSTTITYTVSRSYYQCWVVFKSNDL